MKIKFLLDETLSPRLKVAVLRLNPEIDILRIGEPNTPPLETLDPDVLQYLGLSQRLLVTDNRTSRRILAKKSTNLWTVLDTSHNNDGKTSRRINYDLGNYRSGRMDIVDWIPF